MNTENARPGDSGSSVIEQIRELHAPVEDEIYGPRCDGDNFGGWEAEPPEWPCATALLVYTEEEIEEATEAHKLWQRWFNERKKRERMARGWGIGDDMFLVWRRGLDHTLRSAFPPIPPVKAGGIFYQYIKEPRDND